ncbi:MULTISPECIES: aminotransferase class I/II-fold pyridoxal phosphate-dependent enzyme [unclassified Moraxella]|uniref:aminotransferase class I/II-fold pyridoxal phosphate-dependent enzyme n=1 Tax=unclassified Moraxella TaxID=2685852 RepID=UPI003AF907A8
MLTHFPLTQSLTEQRQSGRYRSLTSITSGVTPAIEIDGKTYVNFASNDYLGLATDPYLVDTFKNTVAEIEQVGSGASHLITGHSVWHDELALTLAEVTGYDKAITFSTGYMANVGVIQALCGKDSVIFSDKLNHASIVDGALLVQGLSRAKVVRFPHRDYAHLEHQLQQTTATQKLIVTDHVFSMDGTFADLDKLHELAQRYECALMVDDAHGFGLPYQAYQNHTNTSKADIYMGTFGKAIGTSGAFVASSHELIEYLINFSRAFIYTTALPPILAKVTQASVKLTQSDLSRADKLLSNIKQLSEGLNAQGWQVGIDDELPTTAIIPVLIGDNDKAVALADKLKSAGFWVSAIRPPTVPVGTARLRFCVSASHSSEQIEQLLTIMASLAQ